MIKSRRLAKTVEDDDENYIIPSVKYKINNTKKADEYLEFLRGLIAPLIETYAVTAFCMDKLVGRSLLESELIEEIMNELKMSLSKNMLKYGKILLIDKTY